MDGQAHVKKGKTILSFFNKKGQQSERTLPTEVPHPNSCPQINIPSSSHHEQQSESDNPYYERDPGKRILMSYYAETQDEVRRAYVEIGPFQPKYEYPYTIFGNQRRRFQSSWFDKWSWLEFSIEKESVYCFPCYLFESAPQRDTFTIDGFKNWKRINSKNCPFKRHEGDGNSLHEFAMQKWENLRNLPQHIDRMIEQRNSKEARDHHLCVSTAVESVKWLALQGCAFRGHDESVGSSNRGNYIEMIKLHGRANKEIDSVTLENAAKNANYTSPTIQKEILKIIAHCVRNKICEEVGDAKFCILVDEAVDQADKEQMAIILRYVDIDGFIRERFFDIVSVVDTNSLTLKKEICNVLRQYKLLLANLRGQGYDGASNMRGEWNGLQALFLKEYPSAYYVHCFAHRLQLALVAVAKEVQDVYLFFQALSSIVNFVTASSKRNSHLNSIRKDEINDFIESGELQTGTGANQVCTLQRAGATRWSSHYSSIKRLIEMFGSTCTLLENLITDGSTSKIRGEAKGIYKAMTRFEFIFILFLMHDVLGKSDLLCQALQMKDQDILNAISFVSTTKMLLQEMRDNQWESFIWGIVQFCNTHNIDIPEFDDRHMEGTRRSCQQQDNITVENYYHFNIFNAVIDFQLTELDSRFTEKTMELLQLCEALNPIDQFKSFCVNDICYLAAKFYPLDFTNEEIDDLRIQLDHYKCDVICNSQYSQIDSLPKLCRMLVETKKSRHYFLLDRLIRLVLTLPVSTATTERAFSAMKLIKTALRNKMEDDFLSNSMTIYIEREIVFSIETEFIVDKFYHVGSRRRRHT